MLPPRVQQLNKDEQRKASCCEVQAETEFNADFFRIEVVRSKQLQRAKLSNSVNKRTL